MSENIYAPPESNPQSVTSALAESENLASRGSRLGASILDSLIISVIVLPIVFFTGGFEGIMEGKQQSFIYTILTSVLSIVVFFAINYKFLLSNGQTIGKKVVGVQIRAFSGAPVGLTDLLKRYGFYFLIGQIPIAGGVLSLANACFIFRKDQRCLHDLVADTKVVKI
ncbi:MAG: RDD family protein [Akkermansiaceae bacterium]